MPKDVPVSQLKILLREIQKESESKHGGKRTLGLRDYAWVLLMLHCGLRTLEVRRIMLDDIDWERRCIRIEQAKGFKDRFVWMTDAVVSALQAYMEARGPKEYLPNELFVYRHKPLSNRYCSVRLRTYYRRCGVSASPHQLRHSCATLLLNSGAPVTTVQAILGHKYVDTTLRYARLYDGTVAQHYFEAMEQVEGYLEVD
jgi:integrase/recombinase XerD